MTHTFKQLNLIPPLLKAVADAGHQEPTAVQAAAIPAALEGDNLCVCAQTGSGKTASFLLPSLQRIAGERSPKKGKGPRILVLTPTRELAQQIEQQGKVYGKYCSWLRSASLVGGTSYGVQTRALSKPIDLVIATPGRLIDHLQQGRLDFQRLDILILDEADRMLDMGFIDDIKTITRQMPADKQTLLFSATLDGAVEKLAAGICPNARRIDIARNEQQGNIAEQLYYCNDLNHKMQLIDYLLRDTALVQAVVFTATKAMSETLADTLSQKGFSAAALHGDMQQGKRNRTLRDVHNGRIKILVATDVAARGIDVQTITHVINFDLPRQAEDYVHRIGRTGRAGRDGIAISFAEVREAMAVAKIERYLKRQLPEHVVESMPPTRRKAKKSAPSARKRFGDKSKTANHNKSNKSNKFNKEAKGGRPSKGRKETANHSPKRRTHKA